VRLQFATSKRRLQKSAPESVVSVLKIQGEVRNGADINNEEVCVKEVCPMLQSRSWLDIGPNENHHKNR